MNNFHRRPLLLPTVVALCLCSICAWTVTTNGAGHDDFSPNRAFASKGVALRDDAGSSRSAAASQPVTAHLLNISTRAQILTGDNVLIGGFIITGSGTKRVIVRGIGPSLASAGIQGALSDPVLELHKPDGKIMINDDWRAAKVDVQTTGVPPVSSKESALVGDLQAGSYTVVLRGKNNTSGIGLVEAYDLDANNPMQLVNISSRGFVGMDNDVLIGGIIIGPTGATNGKLLVRAIGPSLSRAGIAHPLLDPMVELHNGNGDLITSNDNWKDTQQAAIEATGAPPTNAAESAIVFTAAPGKYTAIVRGRNNTTGVALVEVYNIH